MSELSDNQIRGLQLLGHIGDVIVDSQDIDLTLSATVSLIQSMLEVERCSIMLLDTERCCLQMIASAGIARKEWGTICVPVGQGPSGKVVETGEPLLIETDASAVSSKSRAGKAKYKTDSFICVPMSIRGRIIGVINANDKLDGGSFDKHDLGGMVTLANFIAMALDNAHLLLAVDSDKKNLHAILNGMFVGVMMVDLAGHITHVNNFAKKLFGFTEHSCTGKPLSWMLDAELGADMQALVDDTIGSQAPQSRQIDWDSPIAKRLVPLAITTTLIYSERKRVDGVVIIIDDHSMRREVAKLKRIDEVKENFIAMVSHELRTPLTSIKGAIYLLETTFREGLNDGHQNMLRLIKQNTERLITHVNNMLDVTYIESNTLTLVRQRSNIVDIIKTFAPKYETLSAQKQIEFHSEYTADELIVDLDPDKFPKIVENLLDNALKFTRANGQIALTVRASNGACEILVTDTGIGIPLGLQGRIFDRFFQSEHTITREAGGNGLGLYITRALVTLHGGAIELVKSSDAGSQFRVELPLVTK